MGPGIILSGLSIEDFKKIISAIVDDAVERKLKLHLSEPKEQKMYLTRKETSELLGGVSFATLNSWEKAGVLKPFRIGSKVRYRYTDIADQINSKLRNVA